MRAINQNGTTIVRKSIRVSYEELRLLLEQSRRLLLEVTVEKQNNNDASSTSGTTSTTIPSLKRCATEIHGYVPPAINSGDDMSKSAAKMMKLSTSAEESTA
jgi:hypothetical protein